MMCAFVDLDKATRRGLVSLVLFPFHLYMRADDLRD